MSNRSISYRGLILNESQVVGLLDYARTIEDRLEKSLSLLEWANEEFIVNDNIHSTKWKELTNDLINNHKGIL